LLLSCGLKKEIIDYVRNSTRISRIFRIKIRQKYYFCT